MLPDPQKFADEMTALGLGDGMRFVVYDSPGLFAAARVWWTLRAFGAEEVAILDGGLPQWRSEGRPIEPGDAHPRPRRFTPRLNHAFVATLDDVRRALATGSAQVVDARPADRFEGRAPEPRPGVRSGHIPGSLNLPFVEIVEHGRLKRGPALHQAFAAHGVDLAKPVVTTCGSGVTAAVLALAVEEAGGQLAGLYDGSWSEWGAQADCPVVTGPATTS
jgi:thiosulfate/3-mercaptopyruvate sulfurtransferase